MFFGNIEYCGEYEMSGLLSEFDQDDFRNLPAQTGQQVIKQVYADWTSYYAGNKDYFIHPEKYKGKPNIPRYKDKKGYFECVFTNQQVKLKEGHVHFPKATNLEPLKTNTDNVCQVRITPKTSCFVIEVVYNFTEQKAKREDNERKIEKHELDYTKFVALDAGMDNLFTSINNAGLRPFIINGKIAKSFNQWFNKSRAKLQSYLPPNKYMSNRIRDLDFYRFCWMEDKIHKVSTFIVDECLEHNIGNLFIGKNPQWKDSLNFGNKTNQHFICLPIAKFIDRIVYKAEMAGIKVTLTEESYTSKVDHLAYETMEHHEKYLGKRLKRGIFQSSIGKLINADVNGAIGIARKVFGDSVIAQILDSGFAFNPFKLNIMIL